MRGSTRIPGASLAVLLSSASSAAPAQAELAMAPQDGELLAERIDAANAERTIVCGVDADGDGAWTPPRQPRGMECRIGLGAGVGCGLERLRHAQAAHGPGHRLGVGDAQ